MVLTTSSQSAMLQGHEVGEIARKIYDPEGRGHFLDLEKLGFRALFKQSETLIDGADRLDSDASPASRHKPKTNK